MLHFLEGLLLADKFRPDSTRAGRFVGCRNLEQALDQLARQKRRDEIQGDLHSGPSSDSDGSWDKAEILPFRRKRRLDEGDSSDNELVLSQLTDSDVESELHFSEDDDSLDVNGSAVADIVSKAGPSPEQLFRHKVSGIFHIMAESAFDDADGEMSATKCGKLICHNFVRLDGSPAFIPSKCKRCFTK